MEDTSTPYDFVNISVLYFCALFHLWPYIFLIVVSLCHVIIRTPSRGTTKGRN